MQGTSTGDQEADKDVLIQEYIDSLEKKQSLCVFSSMNLINIR